MSMICLYAYLVIVSVWDGITYRIPNAFILIGLILGFGFSFWERGFAGLAETLLTFIVMLILAFLLWAVMEINQGSSIGGGDMKLLVVISLFVGISNTIVIFYYSLIIVSLLFVLITPPKKIIEMLSQFSNFALYSIPSRKEKNLKKIAFSIPIFIALLLQINLFT